ncbi:hypothetical protein NSS79_06025 [Paenibacillus sp. FSL L8-0436]|uniref:hypothetical protein n=1 Tax=Paenibacillus sp. FSL L8-0436 TaxID=2954686 RepID=UPI0031597E0A
MNTDREQIKQRLDEELLPVTFTGHEQVLRQTHPPAGRARLLALWNKELEIPLKAVGACTAILVTGALLLYSPHTGTETQQAVQQPGQRELIKAGGNMYWKDIYERAVKRYEN